MDDFSTCCMDEETIFEKFDKVEKKLALAIKALEKIQSMYTEPNVGPIEGGEMARQALEKIKGINAKEE